MTQHRHYKYILLGVTLSMSVLTSTAGKAAPVGPATAAPAENPEAGKAIGSVNKMQLAKINSSIELTKKKIRATTEVSFVPDLQFLLGELLLQKARLMFLIKKENAKKIDDLDFTAEKRQVMEGVEQLRLVEVKYPTYREMDKVLLTIGLELRKIGDQEKALQSFKKLSLQGTTEAAKGQALLEIGNIFFDKKDYEFALKQYQSVIAMPNNPWTMTAHYKAAWSEINLEHFLSSMLLFEKIFTTAPEDAGQDAGEEKKKDLREDALIASVWPLSELSEKEINEHPRFVKPLQYYQEQSPDRIILRRTLRRLAQRLDLKNRTLEASELAEQAFVIPADLEESLEMMEVVFTLDRKAKRRDVTRPVLRQIAQNLRTLRERGREKDLQKYEPHFREMLTRAHVFYVQSTKRVEDLHILVQGYDDYLKIYPQSKFYAVILLNQAEAAYVGQDYITAAHLYLKVSRQGLAKNKNKVKEFYDSAAQAYASALKNLDNLSLLEKAQARTGYRDLTALYEKAFPQDPNLDAMRFNIAKNYYDEQSYAESAKAFKNYLARYPHSAQTAAAAVLLMDTYYVQDDIKNLLGEGTRLLAGPLDEKVKAKLTQVIQEAKLRQVQSVAGEFATRKYADKFLEVAASSKNSAIGESALSEAFSSLLAGGDAKLYSVGEEYLKRFRQGAHAQEILNQMIKLSLVTLEFDRAANYMQLYAELYPDSSQTASYRAQATMLLESTGQVDKAIEAHLQNKNSLRAAQLAAQYGLWEPLQKIAATLPGGTGLYYQALAFTRQKKSAEAMTLLQRCLADASPADEVLQAHAGVMLAEYQLNDLRPFERAPFSVAVLQKILEISKNTNQTLQGVLAKHSGRWSVAALAITGRLNNSVADTIATAQPPAGMPAANFRKIVDPKVMDYRQAGATAYISCAEIAQKEEIASEYVRMCQSGGKNLVVENMEMQTSPRGRQPAVSMNAKIRAALIRTPKSLDVLKMALQFNQQENNFYGAYAVASRITELEPTLALGWSALGEAAYKVGRHEEALNAFHESLKRDGRDRRALAGIAEITHSREPRAPAGKVKR